MELLDRLQQWFESNCNEEWEHGNGVRIETLDNPGWHVKVSLEDTDWESRVFPEVDHRFRSDHDWVDCRKKELEFHGAGGVQNLNEILTIFLDWAESFSQIDSPPTHYETVRCLQQLIAGELTPEQASQWAQPWSERLGEIDNTKICKSLGVLAGADIPKADRPGQADFEAWLKELTN